MSKEQIKFDKRNYRKHNDKNKELINKSLEECGAGRSILIDNENEIIAGNGVFEQAKQLNIPVKIIETDGSELIAVKRTDLATDDEIRKRLAIMDNSASDTSEFDIELLQADFDVPDLQDMGIDVPDLMAGTNYDDEELMSNQNLQEMQTNKMLALSKMPIDSYLVIKFDESMSKADFIEKHIKKFNPDSDIDVKTQFCTWAFMKKDPLDD
jgi:hypothetical protein